MDTPAEPANLRTLRRLVTGFTVTMIAGVLTILVLIVIRLSQPAAPTAITLPDTIELPRAATPLAVTRGPSWWAVTTSDNHILIYDDSGTLVRDIAVTMPD